MANKTGIQWTDYTINPIVGCQKCSPGCENCYAERGALRMARNPNLNISSKYAPVVDANGWNGDIAIDKFAFEKLPKKPSRVFVCSMGDLFYKTAPELFRTIVVEMTRYEQHTFMLLTKRPERFKEYFKWLPDNIWLGVTVCNQAEADEKIPILLDTPAAKRFISVEPQLGAIDLSRWVFDRKKEIRNSVLNEYQADAAIANSLDWVICGGETGKNARFQVACWPYMLRDQCVKAGVPFFFKGCGDNMRNRLIDKTLHRELDGREWNEVPKCDS